MQDMNTDSYVTEFEVRRRLGLTEPGLRKWRLDPEVKFPLPMIVRGRRYYLRGEILAWEKARRAPASKSPEAA